MTRRATLAVLLAATLSGCATAPAPAATTTAADCAVLMLVGGFIAEHQPPLHLAVRTQDVETAMARRSPPLQAINPERFSPDAKPDDMAAIAAAREARRRPPEAIGCPLKGPSPFRRWLPGRGELLLSNPAVTPKGDFAVVDAAVVLPRQRTDYYRFVLSGPPEGAWDLHRIEFASKRSR